MHSGLTVAAKHPGIPPVDRRNHTVVTVLGFVSYVLCPDGRMAAEADPPFVVRTVVSARRHG